MALHRLLKAPVRPILPSTNNLYAIVGGTAFKTLSTPARTSRRFPVLLPVGHERPEDARVLVGERHRGDVRPAPRGERIDPAGAGIVLAFRGRYRGARPVDQERAQVRVPALADTEQHVLPAGPVLPRHEPEPRRP